MLAMASLAGCRIELPGASTVIVANFTREPVTVFIAESGDGGWSESRDRGVVRPGSRRAVFSTSTSTPGATPYLIEARGPDGVVKCRWDTTLAEIAERDYTLYVDEICGDLSKLTPQAP
jgi:hypothetical protein